MERNFKLFSIVIILILPNLRKLKGKHSWNMRIMLLEMRKTTKKFDQIEV